MKSDLFHDVARAYYGVGPEVYTLANIATNGAAPEGYAMGCESGSPNQYAADDARPTSRDYELLADYNELAPDLVRAAEILSKHGLHDEAAKAHGSLSNFFSDLDQRSNYAPASKLAIYHESQRDHHLASAKPAKTGSTGGYVSPGLPAPPKQPKSMPGQKSLLACSQPYALGDSNTGSADDDPMMKRRGASGMYPAQPRPMSSFGTRITLAGDYPSKPDFSETGTGDHVSPKQRPWTGPDPTEGAKPPFVSHRKGMTAEQDMIRRQNNEAAGHENEPIDSYALESGSADEEDYGIMDAASKAAKNLALGTGIAISAMGGQGQASEPSGLSIARQYADPITRAARMKDYAVMARSMRGSTAAEGPGQRAARFLQTPAGRQWIKAPTEIAKPARGADDLTRLDPLDANAHSGGPISVETNYEQMKSLGKTGYHKPPKIDFSETGTGTRVDREKNSLPSDDISPSKAKKILEDGTAQGHPLTDKQKKMFGAAAGKSKK